MVWHNLNAEHEGKYKCVVNVDDEEQKEIVELKVHSKSLKKSIIKMFMSLEYPKFLTMDHDQHFEIGTTARLQCAVTDPTKADLFWTRNDLPIVASDRIQFEEYGAILVIQNFTTADNDQYACNLPKANSFDTFAFNVAGTCKQFLTNFYNLDDF